MATISPSTPTGVIDSVFTKLASLRRAIRGWILIDGFMRIGVIIFLVVVIDLALDWLMKMDFAQRVVCLGLMIAVLGYSIFRFLIRPLIVKFSDDMLCLQVEQQHHELGQGLISAMQFARITSTENLGVSNQLIDATIAQGTSAAQGINFNKILDVNTLRVNFFILLVTIGTFVGAFVGLPNTMQTWLNRNIALGDQKWPQDTKLKVEFQDERTSQYLEITDLDGSPSLILPNGGDLNIRVTASGEIPSTVNIFLPSGGLFFGNEKRIMVAQEEAGGKREFEYSFKNVQEEFEFFIEGGDVQTKSIKIHLVDRPMIQKLELELIPPKYTELKQQSLPEGKGPYVFYKGSTLLISGQSSKPLKSAALVREEETVDLEVDGYSFSGKLSPQQLIGGEYNVRLIDSDDRNSKQKANFKMTLKSDQPPRIKIKADGIGGMIVSKARIPVHCSLKDDFQLTAASLHYEWTYTDADPKKSKTGSGVIPFNSADLPLNRQEVENYVHLFDVEPLNLPVGTSLIINVEAQDNYNPFNLVNSGGSQSQIGVSRNNIVVRIVTEGDLLDNLSRREEEQSQAMDRLIRDNKGQDSLEVDTNVLLLEFRKKPILNAAQYKNLKLYSRYQAAIGKRSRRIATRIEQLAKEYINNRLDDLSKKPGETSSYRLRNKIADPLFKLTNIGGLIPKTTALLQEVRLGSQGDGNRLQTLKLAVDNQEKILAKLESIELEMKKSTSIQKMINIARKLEILQIEAKRIADEEKERSTGGD